MSRFDRVVVLSLMKPAALLALVVAAAGCTGGADALQTEECGVRQRPPAHFAGVHLAAGVPEPGSELFSLCVPPGVRVEDGLARCTIREHVPTDEGGCGAQPGRMALRIEPDYRGREHELCEIVQVGTETEAGWRYFATAGLPPESWAVTQCGADGHTIQLTAGETFLPSSTVEVTCHLVEGSHGNTVGSECASDDRWGCDGGPIWGPDGQSVVLACDAESSRCAVPCSTADDCTGAGFANDVCNARGVCVPGVCRFE